MTSDQIQNVSSDATAIIICKHYNASHCKLNYHVILRGLYLNTFCCSHCLPDTEIFYANLSVVMYFDTASHKNIESSTSPLLGILIESVLFFIHNLARSELGCKAILTVFEVEMNDDEMRRLKFIICLDDHVARL